MVVEIWLWWDNVVVKKLIINIDNMVFVYILNFFRNKFQCVKNLYVFRFLVLVCIKCVIVCMYKMGILILQLILYFDFSGKGIDFKFKCGQLFFLYFIRVMEYFRFYVDVFLLVVRVNKIS